MAARRDRSGLTAKESKIVSKKSRLFDSNTQGIGLPQKSSKATITGRKPGKPKPTAGKGLSKNVITTGGKAGRAIENKMRSQMGLPKLKTTGKIKAINKANYKIGDIRRTEGVGAVTVTKSGKLKEFMSDAPVKGATRKVRDNAQRAELEAKGYSKRKSVGKYPSKKLMKDIQKQAFPKPKVPVKPRGGLRGGGMGFGGGGGLRGNVNK
jgi:hypothetical protein